MCKPETDLVGDILERVRAEVDLPAPVAARIERETRLYWGGDRHYVALDGEAPRRREASDRAQAIRDDYHRGERIPLLARRYGISERHVRRLLGMASHDDQAGIVTLTKPPRRYRKNSARMKCIVEVPPNNQGNQRA